MNIRIDDKYVLKSDERNVILVRLSVGQSGKSEGKVVETNVGFYGTVQAALKDYQRIQTNLSEATTIKELLDDVEKIHKTIENVLKGV